MHLPATRRARWDQWNTGSRQRRTTTDTQVHGISPVGQWRCWGPQKEAALSACVDGRAGLRSSSITINGEPPGADHTGGLAASALAASLSHAEVEAARTGAPTRTTAARHRRGAGGGEVGPRSSDRSNATNLVHRRTSTLPGSPLNDKALRCSPRRCASSWSRAVAGAGEAHIILCYQIVAVMGRSRCFLECRRISPPAGPRAQVTSARGPDYLSRG